MGTIPSRIKWWLVEVATDGSFDGWIDARNNLISHFFESRARRTLRKKYHHRDEKMIFASRISHSFEWFSHVIEMTNIVFISQLNSIVAKNSQKQTCRSTNYLTQNRYRKTRGVGHRVQPRRVSSPQGKILSIFYRFTHIPKVLVYVVVPR